MTAQRSGVIYRWSRDPQTPLILIASALGITFVGTGVRLIHAVASDNSQQTNQAIVDTVSMWCSDLQEGSIGPSDTLQSLCESLSYT
jgi:hypothetical protein